jgi:hypothetical protein
MTAKGGTPGASRTVDHSMIHRFATLRGQHVRFDTILLG